MARSQCIIRDYEPHEWGCWLCPSIPGVRASDCWSALRRRADLDGPSSRHPRFYDTCYARNQFSLCNEEACFTFVCGCVCARGRVTEAPWRTEWGLVCVVLHNVLFRSLLLDQTGNLRAPPLPACANFGRLGCSLGLKASRCAEGYSRTLAQSLGHGGFFLPDFLSPLCRWHSAQHVWVGHLQSPGAVTCTGHFQ